MLNDFLESPRHKRIGQIEAVNIGLGDPPLHLIGDLLGGTDNGSTEAANLDVICHCVLRPLGYCRASLTPGLDG